MARGAWLVLAPEARRGFAAAVVTAFGALTGLGVLPFLSGLWARFSPTGIMLSLTWNPSYPTTGYLLLVWLTLVIAVRLIIPALSPRTVLACSSGGFAVVLLFWLLQGAWIGHAARALSTGALQAGLRSSIEREDLSTFLFYLYAETQDLPRPGPGQNDALIRLARTLAFINRHELALDALLQVQRQAPFNPSYWLLYAGETVATHNWPYLDQALADWQTRAVGQEDWSQLAECWNTATLFSVVYGRQAGILQHNLLAAASPATAGVIRTIMSEPETGVDQFVQAARRFGRPTAAGILWAGLKMEMVHDHWQRAFALAQKAMAMDPGNNRLAVDAVHAAIGAERYQDGYDLIRDDLPPDSAEANYLAAVTQLALDHYQDAQAAAERAEDLARQNGYMELALTSHALREAAMEKQP